MGLIRKSLFLGTGGIVAPNSKKQRAQKQVLAALQGQSPEQVRRAGGRYEHSLGAFFEGSSGELAAEPDDPAREAERCYRQRGHRHAPPPLWRDQAQVKAAGGRFWDTASYFQRDEEWRRRYLAAHPDIAARLFPDGIPQEPDE